MKLVWMWLFGVPLVVASMILASHLTGNTSTPARAEVDALRCLDYSTTTRTSCSAPSNSNGTTSPAQVRSSSHTPIS